MKLRLLLVLVGLTVGGKNEETRYERRKRKRLDKTPEDKVKKIQSLSQKWCAHFMRKDEHSKFSWILTTEALFLSDKFTTYHDVKA